MVSLMPELPVQWDGPLSKIMLQLLQNIDEMFSLLWFTTHDNTNNKGAKGAAGMGWPSPLAPWEQMKKDRDLKISEEMPWSSAQRMEA